MGLVANLKKRIDFARDPSTADAARRIALSGYFQPEDIAWILDTYAETGGVTGSRWDALRDAHMELPDWFVSGLDPMSDAYAEQQHRLWQIMSGIDRRYIADIDEREHSWGDIDPVRSPGFFVKRDAQAVSTASDQLIATGMLLKHSGLEPGQWALEYGAGFGQTALALARLGVNVDTVDISRTFCEYVRRQAEFFQVPLTPFHGRFGLNPRPGQKYNTIWFYESFHHCLDFKEVVRQMRDLLASGGRVILGGEPIVESEYAAVPYPWGMRLHSEVAAVVRQHHWFELGFSERFLFELFTAEGFVGHRIECEPSLFGRLYVFQRRSAEVQLGTQWLPRAIAEHWQAPETEGRRTRSNSTLPVDTGEDFHALEVDLSNPLPWRQQVQVTYGNQTTTAILNPSERTTLRFAVSPGARELAFRCTRGVPTLIDRLRRRSGHRSGVLVRRLRYEPL